MAQSPGTEVNVQALGECWVQLPPAVVETRASSAASKVGPAPPPTPRLQLKQFWQKQTTILIFLRHFACIACRAHARQVWADREKYEQTGGRLVFVGNGQPHFIRKFQEELNLEGAIVVTDPGRASFKLAGFHEGFFYVVQPASAVNAVKLATQGHKQTSYSTGAGTHWQLGGIIVVSPASKVLYHFISESLGDFPEERNLKFIQRNEV